MTNNEGLSFRECFFFLRIFQINKIKTHPLHRLPNKQQVTKSTREGQKPIRFVFIKQMKYMGKPTKKVFMSDIIADILLLQHHPLHVDDQQVIKDENYYYVHHKHFFYGFNSYEYAKLIIVVTTERQPPFCSNQFNYISCMTILRFAIKRKILVVSKSTK